MRERLRNMGVNITELSEIMGISRPTAYKFIDMYDKGQRDKIDPHMLKLLDHIKRNPRISKRDVLHYMLLIQGGKENIGQRVPSIVTVTPAERPARKLIVLRSKNAVDYLSYCEEKGCEWTDIMNGIPERFDDAAIVTLPEGLTAPGTSSVVSGVEVPQDYSRDVPDGYEIMDLLPCTLLYFTGSVYDDEDDFCEAINIITDALTSYEPERFGWMYDTDAGPSFNFGSCAEKGARIAVPVKKI